MNLGHIIDSGKPFQIITPKFLKTHTFCQGVTGAGKTAMLLKIVEEMRTKEFQQKYDYIPIILLDDAGEFLKISEKYEDFVVLNSKYYSEFLTIDDAFLLGKRVRELGISIIIQIKDLGTEQEQERFVGQFVRGLMAVEREYWKPCVFVIDEADIYVPTKRRNVDSKQPIINACKRARKTNLVITLATQYASDVSIDARRQCHNRIIGKTVELADRRVVAEMLGDKSLVEKLWGLGTGQFYMRGDALSESLLQVQVHESKIGSPDVGAKYITVDNKVVGSVLRIAMKHNTSEPLVIEQHRRITELEDQIVELKSKQLIPEKKCVVYD